MPERQRSDAERKIFTLEGCSDLGIVDQVSLLNSSKSKSLRCMSCTSCMLQYACLLC